jgi:DNA (cytosine-5)-methyltransferase 1
MTPITITDLFCGAGGSTTGAIQAGAEVRLAMNHWPRAIETHSINYPGVEHVLADISQADPRHFPSTTILIASPECTSHSLAKGRQRKGHGQLSLWETKTPDPSEERSRCTMWDPLRFAEYHQYPIVILENVVDAHYWRLWESWLHAWRALDYAWEIVYLNSMFVHPTPQSRDRMYVVAWKRTNRRPDLTITPLAFCAHCGQDQQAVQSWKNPARPWGKYGRGGQYVYRCPVCLRVVTPYHNTAASVIEWSRPIQRIGDRAKPLKAKTLARIASGLEKFAGHPFFSERQSTSTARSDPRPRSPLCAGKWQPGSTIPPAWLLTYYHNGQLVSVREPIPTVTTLERHALITASGETPHVEDCGFRMLEPSEIQAAMAFPRDYVVTGTRREKVKQLGNAVTPPVMQLLVSRCMAALA